MRMSSRGIPRASMAATSGRHVMVLVYLNVRIRLSILHILWQDVSCNMCSRKSTYRHCAHGSHRQQWLELCANAQHMQSKRQEHTQRHGHALSKVSTGARTPTPIFGIPGSAEAHVNTQHPATRALDSMDLERPGRQAVYSPERTMSYSIDFSRH